MKHIRYILDKSIHKYAFFPRVAPKAEQGGTARNVSLSNRTLKHNQNGSNTKQNTDKSTFKHHTVFQNKQSLFY